MAAKISGMAFDVSLMGRMVHISKASLTISDNTAVAQTRGVPDGYTDGDVTADVEYELDADNFLILNEAARSAGSWRGMEPHDSLFYAKRGNTEVKVEVFGVKLILDSLLDIDPKSADKSGMKLKGIVTSPDFVRINGVPVLSEDDTRDLIG
ncbi:MAG: phage protein [Plesiomonas sp.]|uniref:DUF2597 family protein n=1 Tax=Plesiomonas shigelloides TaxID=703 RepID=A0A8I1W4U6_PLESH|nr:phage protein [Plesiomonas shigelloides]KAB7698798.1 DUF2597 family protein [Plesiomonas shigelloides]MBO1107897.1 DUF2597 family protein [Plesiomonas shigelloides]